MQSVGEFVSSFMKREASEKCKALESFRAEKIFIWFEILSLQNCIVMEQLRLSFKPPEFTLSFNATSLGIGRESDEQKARRVFGKVCEYIETHMRNTIIIPITFGTGMTYHTNVLIINPVLRQIERFEPYGVYRRKAEIEQNATVFELEKAVNLFMRMHLHDYCPALLNFPYVTTADFCPTMAPQVIAESKVIERVAKGESVAFVGYCTAWSMMYAHLRVTFPQLNGEIILKQLLDSVERNKGFLEKTPVAMTKLVRNYACYLTSLEEN